jgi:hypothetical protein
VIAGTITIRAVDVSRGIGVNDIGRFVPLTGEQTVPNGSEIDATHGRVVVTVATTKPGRTQTAEVYGGLFRIEQEHGGLGVTRFVLTLRLTGCPRVTLPRGSAASAASVAGPHTVARRHRKKHRRGPTRRHLWVSEGGGNWGTSGRYVSTTVEGTDWITQDECVHSRVRVVSGRVAVRNLLTRRNKLLTAGQSYVAVRR